MKTKPTQLIILFLFLFLINSSCRSDKKNKSTENESRNLVIDICNYPCAILDKEDSYFYDTEKGTAYYSIPVPYNGQLKQLSKTSTSIEYEVTGGDYQNNNISFNKQNIANLSTTPEDSLTIIVTYKNADCEQNNFVDKKKKSVVVGHPFVLECGSTD